jgi:hypothetical protein
MSTPISSENTSTATTAEAIALGDLARVTGGADKPAKQLTEEERKEIQRKLGDQRRLVGHELTHVVQTR